MGRGLLLLGAAVIAVSACANQTPEQKHEVGCVAGTLTGAVIGGLIGSTIGAGTGKEGAVTLDLDGIDGGRDGHGGRGLFPGSG